MKLIRLAFFMALAVYLSMPAYSQNTALDTYRWTIIDAKGDVKGRHENTFVEYKGKFYLMGGRGINPVNVFDPTTNTWEAKGLSPMQIHHFQAVVLGDAIYLVGGMSGGYPKEEPLENIWIYYPESDKWEKGPEIPEGRRRGGAGVVVYDQKIYIVCGIDYGHTSGTNNDFDCFDPATGKWEMLTRAPHIRDHFPAIVVGDKLYCIGGRNTSVHFPDNFGAFFNAVVPWVDVYDFSSQTWVTLPEPISYATAAGGLVEIDSNLLYIGGEGPFKQAYNHTQALDLRTGKWHQLAPLVIGRHGTGAILYEGNVYIAAGSQQKGGGNMNSIEVFSVNHNLKSIFSGTDLSGWTIECREDDRDKEYWTVEDGAIVCNTHGNKNHSYIWLQSIEEYADFELRFKFQASRENQGNSGIQIRSRWDANAIIEGVGGGIGWMDGPQIDIDPNNPWRNGFIYDETRETRRWINPSLPDLKIDKETYAPKKVFYYWDDEEPGWNDMVIVCNGTHITTYVNNLIVSDYDGKGILDDKAHKKYKVGMNGHIAFQLHMNNANYLRFKDIEIRKIQ